MDQIARHVVFKGRVQGVGFRYTVHRIARQYDLSGYVKNMSNGSVEALFQGTETHIAGCMQDIEESFSGYIRETKSADQPVSSHYDDFKIAF